MAQVITRCPMTGHYLFMGIEVDPEQFANFPETFTRKYCPYCCCDHAWYKKDTQLVVRRQPRSSVSPRAVS
jgi:hypothetical protein